MCIAADFDEMTSNGGIYYSPTFAADKFIHATADPQFLLEAGNHFYLQSKGDWICLKLDVSKLPVDSVIFEAPAPVGIIEAVDYKKEHSFEEQPKFPHIYAGIGREAVVQEFKIVRSEQGAFLNIDGLC